ncbi:MAG: hypothetical protein ABJM75_11715 [Luteolibacter sp.]
MKIASMIGNFQGKITVSDAIVIRIGRSRVKMSRRAWLRDQKVEEAASEAPVEETVTLLA